MGTDRQTEVKGCMGGSIPSVSMKSTGDERSACRVLFDRPMNQSIKRREEKRREQVNRKNEGEGGFGGQREKVALTNNEPRWMPFSFGVQKDSLPASVHSFPFLSCTVLAVRILVSSLFFFSPSHLLVRPSSACRPSFLSCRQTDRQQAGGFPASLHSSPLSVHQQ
mmetsp:Transcript_31065/g.61241  ORF Transcript_31065/g.61241 Transcript_31065/m.61241 type:complete len:166 (+) Transcript_31065:848-1345(+)